MSPRVARGKLTKSASSNFTKIALRLVTSLVKPVAGPSDGLANFANHTSLTCTLTQTVYPGPWSNVHPLLPRLSLWRIKFGSRMTTPREFFEHYPAPALKSLEITGLSQPVKRGAWRIHRELRVRSAPPRPARVADAHRRATSAVLAFTHAGELRGAGRATATAVTNPLLGARTDAALLPKLKELMVEGTRQEAGVTGQGCGEGGRETPQGADIKAEFNGITSQIVLRQAATRCGFRKSPESCSVKVWYLSWTRILSFAY
ncbi:hypothetical protein DFH09DRAFT_1068737 [Mycena vulgaris]|nr:hypothetical protein DFH09DRAFT_1068737 [Mycena vulgaris]